MAICTLEVTRLDEQIAQFKSLPTEWKREGHTLTVMAVVVRRIECR